MSDVTHILSQLDQGDLAAAEHLLPLVYDELRKLAAARLAKERPGHSLDATALVHEAYLRLTKRATGSQAGGSESLGGPAFAGRAHFFAAAAEAMRRILVENARRRQRLKRGGNRHRLDFQEVTAPSGADPALILAVHEALAGLAAEDPAGAEIVKVHFFLGLSLEEAAVVLGISRATAYRRWAYARAWLKLALAAAGESAAPTEDEEGR